MNGSRSDTPNYGSKSSLDQLNRTIEGLEARIQGLVSERKQAQTRPARTNADPLGEIMERQRVLGGTRERVAAAMERAPRPEPEIRHPAYRAEPTPTYERQNQHNAMGEIAATLSALRAEIKHDIQDTIAPDLNAIVNDMRALKSTTSGASSSSALVRDELSRLGDSIARLESGIRFNGSEDLRADLEELRAMTAGLAREDSIRSLEQRWDRAEDKLSNFDPELLKEELVQLAWRIDGIKSGLGEFSAAPAVRSLEDKLIAVAGAIEAIGRNVDARSDMTGQFAGIAGQFAGLEGRLDEISRAIAASASQSASAMDTTALRRLESRIGELASHVDSLAQSTPETGVAARIDALSMRIEDLANEDAAHKLEERIGQLSNLIERNFRDARSPDLSVHLEDISRKIDGLGGNPADELIARLERLSHQIEEFEMPADASPRAMADLTAMSRLETHLSDIATRLDESAAASPADNGALQSLERQIASLSGLLSQPSHAAQSVMPDDFYNRMASIEDYISASDEFIVEAARQAAEAVVEAYSRTGIGAQNVNASDISALSDLAEDLKALEAHTRSSEERTAETFSALHQTLVQIASRLDEFGSEPVVGAAQQREAYRSVEIAASAPMPKAPQPEYAEAEFSPARFVPAEETMRRPPENPRVAVLQEHDILQEAAEADIALDAVEAIDAGTKKQKPASKSLIAGLAARLKPAKKEPAAGGGRVSVDPAPALDAGEMLVTEDSSLLLEPGSGVPDVKKIMAKVRAGQKASADASPVGGQADVIAAARRAAQAAAQETGQQKFVQPAAKDKQTAKVKKPAGGGEIRRPILLAAAAVLLVVMSYPLVSNLIGNRQAEIQAEVTPVAAEPIAQETASAPVAVEPDRALNAQAIEPADQATVDAAPVAEPQNIETGAEKLMAPAEDASKTGTLEKSDATSPATESATTPSGANPVVTANATDGTADTIQAPTAAQNDATAGDATLPAGMQPAALADAAKKGDPLAFFEIGARYTDGRGGAKVDLAEAAKWYQLAAEKGLAPAEYRLANFYEKGTGVARDMAKAKALYLSAAEKGNASAMHNLAVLHATGAAGTPDFNEAARWFQKAAELNVRDSQFNLAILYARGNGVAQDLEESYKWFAVAAKQGDRDAAQKRDEVANALSPDKLKSAKAKLDLWKPVELNDKANSAVVPDAWLAKSNTTASIDMKRAIRNIQAILNNNGFDAGKPDGEMGKKTVDAIKAFQISVGQQPSGRIDDALVKELLARNKKA